MYGYSTSADRLNDGVSKGAEIAEAEADLGDDEAAEVSDEWVASWAGGAEGLIRILAESTSDAHISKAAQCLSLLPASTSRALLLESPAVIPVLARSSPASWDCIIDITHAETLAAEDWAFFSSPPVMQLLPTTHVLYPLCLASEVERVGIAWLSLAQPPFLEYLYTRCQTDINLLANLLDAPHRPSDYTSVSTSSGAVAAENKQRSKLYLLVRAAKTYANDLKYHHHLDLALKLLHLAPSPNHQDAHVCQARVYLARELPLLALSYNIAVDVLSPGAAGKGRATKDLDIGWLKGNMGAGRVMAFKMHALRSQVIHGRLCDPYIEQLLSTLLHTSLHAVRPNLLAPYDDNALLPADTHPNRAYNRLLSHLSTPTKPSAIVHSLSPAELIKLLAPDLHSLLSTAREPMLGIQPSDQSRGAGAQASDFAGKVYGGHEFRNRGQQALSSTGQAEGVLRPMSGSSSIGQPTAEFRPAQDAGLVVGGAATPVSASASMGRAGSAGGLAVPVQAAAGATGGGIGMGALAVGGRISRPASRHVDDYAG